MYHFLPLLVICYIARCSADDLGARPVMGWSTFDVHATTHPGYGNAWLNETNVKGAADAMARNLKTAGYSYINIDSYWSSGFDANGIPVPDVTRFPSGIDGMAAYVHARGLKLGIYTTVGLAKWGVYDANTPIKGGTGGCRSRDIAKYPLADVPNGWSNAYQVNWSHPCAQIYVNSIADRFASWDIDLLKVDGTTDQNVPDVEAWSAALRQTGRDIWFTLSAWPVPVSIAAQVRGFANGVRIDTDVDCYCETLTKWTASVDTRWDDLPKWLPFLGNGTWPDLDSMTICNNVGDGVQDGLSDVERQTVMTFWSMASSPLWVGGDIARMDDAAKTIVTNPEVIAVDQVAVMPTQITSGGTLQKWRKVLGDGMQAVAVYNLGTDAADIEVTWSELGITGRAAVRDLAARRDLGNFTQRWTAVAVPNHGSRLVTVSTVDSH